MRKGDPEGEKQAKLSFKEDEVTYLSEFFRIHVTNDSARISRRTRIYANSNMSSMAISHQGDFFQTRLVSV